MHMKKIPNLLVVSGMLALIMALALGAAYSAATTQAGLTAGTTAYLVDGAERPIDESAFRTALADFAREHDTTITLEATSADASPTETWFFIAERTSPGGVRDWLSHPPRPFLPGYTITARPHSELTDIRGGRGMYWLDPADGDGDAALAAFRGFLDVHGLTGQPLENRWLEMHLSEPATIVLVATMLLCLVLGTLHAVLRAREHGIRRLQGQTTPTIAMSAHRAALRRLVPGWLLVTAVAAVGLYAFNRFHGLAGFLAYSTAIGATLLVVTSAGFLAGLAVTATSPLLGAIKGQLPLAGLTAGVWAVRLAALLLLLTMTANAIGDLAAHRRLNADAQAWSSHDRPVAAFIAGSSGDDMSALAQPLREMDRRGQILMAASEWHAVIDAPADMPPVLLMNTTAALDSGALTPDEAAAQGDTALLVIPAGTSPEAVASVRDQLHAEFDYARDTGAAVPDIADITVPRGRSVFTYATSFGFQPPPATVADPIVAVLPPGLAGIADYNLTSALSQATVLLHDRAAYDALAATDAGRAMLAGSERAVDRWTQSRRSAADSALQNLGGALIALVLATAAVASTALTHHLRHARALHVHALMGHHPLAGRGGLVAAEVVFAAIVAAWLGHRQHAYLTQLAAGTSRARELTETVAVSPPLVVTALAFVAFWALITTAVAVAFDEANLKENSPA